MEQKRALIVENCNASRAGAGIESALTVLREAGFEVERHQPHSAGEMDRLLRQEAVAGDLVVLAGGDGTIHAALPAAIQNGCPLGILPFGTANDLALTLGIPDDPAAAARIIVEGSRRRIDIAHVNGIAFVNAASIGLAVKITRRLKEDRKRSWGKLSYVLTALETIAEAEPFDAIVECDGNRVELTAHQITVGNGVYYGAGMAVAEDAAIDDGVFDVYALETNSLPSLVALAPALRSGRLVDSREVQCFRCRSLRIETNPAIKVSTDGEIATDTPAEFVISRAALEVLAPAP